MATTRQLREIFELCFNEPRRWTNWFFSSIARDSDVVALDIDGRTLSAALMQRYLFAYCGATLPSAYISCVGTRPESRGHGHATALLGNCLRRAHAEGLALAELIPAEPHLFDYYRHAAGFATAFYVEERHYTALHPFEACGEVIEPDYDILHRLEQRHGCGVLHSPDDFKYILTDLSLDCGAFMTAARCGDHVALAVAVDDGRAPSGGIGVRALLADSAEAAETVMAEVRRRVGERPLSVWNVPSEAMRSLDLKPRGMVRIVNAEKVLSALAQGNKELNYTVRLRDALLPENFGCYRLHGGSCERIASHSRHLDLDVDITTLATILFSAPATGSIFNLPTRRPFISMMLD